MGNLVPKDWVTIDDVIHKSSSGSATGRRLFRQLLKELFDKHLAEQNQKPQEMPKTEAPPQLKVEATAETEQKDPFSDVPVYTQKRRGSK